MTDQSHWRLNTADKITVELSCGCVVVDHAQCEGLTNSANLTLVGQQVTASLHDLTPADCRKLADALRRFADIMDGNRTTGEPAEHWLYGAGWYRLRDSGSKVVHVDSATLHRLYGTIRGTRRSWEAGTGRYRSGSVWPRMLDLVAGPFRTDAEALAWSPGPEPEDMDRRLCVMDVSAAAGTDAKQDAETQLATVTGGPHEGKTVCILAEFEHWCWCDMGDGAGLAAIRHQHLRRWKSVDSVGGAAAAEPKEPQEARAECEPGTDAQQDAHQEYIAALEAAGYTVRKLSGPRPIEMAEQLAAVYMDVYSYVDGVDPPEDGLRLFSSMDDAHAWLVEELTRIGHLRRDGDKMAVLDEDGDDMTFAVARAKSVVEAWRDWLPDYQTCEIYPVMEDRRRNTDP